MKFQTGLALVILTVAIFLSGCAQDGTTVHPAFDATVEMGLSISSNSHNLFGLYTFICDPDKATVDVTPLRNADMHLNALKFLEPPPLLYLTLESPPQFNGNLLDVDIGLINPYLGLVQFTGFDVCGIVFTHGSESGFADPEIVMAGEGDTRLLNADGYTRWWNPAEFPHGDTIFNYIDGMLGTPSDLADFNCTINGYKYFADDLDKNAPLTELDISNRGMFSAGKKNVRHYTIDISGGLIFNYAIDACWKKPSIIPPQNIPDDFPPGANRPEAWNVKVTELTNTLHYEESTGLAFGEMLLLIDVWDHFNASLNQVYCESLAGLPLTTALTPIGGGEGYSTYMLDLTGIYLTSNGDADLLISVKSEAVSYGGALPGIPVTAYFIHPFTINDNPNKGWARTWGGNSFDNVNHVTFAPSGSIYITGPYMGTVDFDPGDGVEERISEGSCDIYMSKFNKYGDFQWVRAWGGNQVDSGHAVAVDEFSDVYITGRFCGDNVDFDPGPGIEFHSSFGFVDAFLCKYDSEGNLLWSKTFGGTGTDHGNGLAFDASGNIYIIGTFYNTVDFDPGPEVEEHTSNGNMDIFLSKFNATGEFIWCVTWGGEYYAGDNSRSIITDNQDNIYVTGYFGDTVDFNPGTGVDEHTSQGKRDSFLSKFNTNGVFHWALTWGGEDDDEAHGIALDEFGNVYVTGYFRETVDLDPGPGIDNHICDGFANSFLLKFDVFGNFQWARSWGGLGVEMGDAVAVDSNGFVLVEGIFEDIVDFDPGQATAERESNGSRDICVSKFNPDGDFIWVSTWGGYDKERSAGFTVDSAGYAYAAGDFESTVDFDPGPDVCELTSKGFADAFLCKLQPDGTW